MTVPLSKVRWILIRQWFNLVVVLIVAVVAVGTAYYRNEQTQRVNEENRRLNGCVRDVIATISARSEFSAQLDEQDTADREATRAFWSGVAAAGQDRARARQIFDEYRKAGDQIEARRAVIIEQRNAHGFPSLAECQ